jgi:putative colanic acid biosysnthesis UDP-glucose lipid carrier transferase
MDLQVRTRSRSLPSGPARLRAFSISSHFISAFVVALDTVAIVSAGWISYELLIGGRTDVPDYYVSAVCFVWLTALLLMNLASLYHFEEITRPYKYVDRFLMAFVTTFMFLIAAAFSLKVSESFSRIWFGSFAAGSLIATILVRSIVAYFLGRLADARIFTRRVAIAGGGEQAQHLLAHIERLRPRFVSVAGVFFDDSSEKAEAFGRYPVLGRIDDLTAYVRAGRIDDVIIALPWSADERITALVRRLREFPVNTYLSADLVGFRLQLRQAPGHFETLPLNEIMGRPFSGWGGLIKAVEDFVLGVLLTIFFLPVMAVIALLIKLDSPGPVIFRQNRYGLVNDVFRIFKFRTMRHDVDDDEANATPQATRDDPRVTRLGRFLRRTSLDELPQLFNVLNGTMSIVGPRPHAIDHNVQYSQEIRSYLARHRVKPGITGWAQVNGYRGETRTTADMEARVRYDVAYIENWSLFFDLKILALTPIVWLSGRNAY